MTYDFNITQMQHTNKLLLSKERKTSLLQLTMGASWDGGRFGLSRGHGSNPKPFGADKQSETAHHREPDPKGERPSITPQQVTFSDPFQEQLKTTGLA